MSAITKAQLRCRCSECETVFQLTVDQLSTRGGLVQCGSCRTVFNAAWSLVDEIPNPAETATPVALEPTTRSTRRRPHLEVPDGPGFTNGERLFSLDDQLRHELQLSSDDDDALEEIRRTLGPTDVEPGPRERWALPIQGHIRSRTPTAARPRSGKSDLVANTPLVPDPLQTKRRTVSSSSGRRTVPTILWLLLMVTTFAGLFIQVRYILFDELAVIPSARAPLEAFCKVVNCRVPPPLTGPIFRILQTRVDLDPQVPGAIVVKIHLVNRTITPRAYPPIQLTLTNRDGEIIGRRTYLAQDYGQGAVGNELTPRVVTVVTLHLAGPDEKAVGFEASIVEPSN